MKKKSEILLASYIDALHSIIYINHFDFNVIDEIISSIGKKVNIIEFNNALGMINFKTKSPMLECDLENFLLNSLDYGYDDETFIVLKDIHNDLNNPKIIALLKRIAEDNLYRDNYNTTILIARNYKNSCIIIVTI